MLSMREMHSENDTSRPFGRSPARAGAGAARRARSAHRAATRLATIVTARFSPRSRQHDLLRQVAFGSLVRCPPLKGTIATKQ